MANLQKTLDDLQPYVVGIRYVDGIPLVDCIFKDGWTLPDSNIITKVRGNEEMNYNMLFSEKDGIGLDELLDYVSAVIKVNTEREKKQELLKQKFSELKELFKKTSLGKLRTLKFTFSDDDFTTNIDEISLDEEPKNDVIQNEPIEEPKPIEENNESNSESDDELELIAEERRAENFRNYQESIKKNKQLNSIKNKVELPPKASIQEVISDECDCGPNEACNKCIENKDL